MSVSIQWNSTQIKFIKIADHNEVEELTPHQSSILQILLNKSDSAAISALGNFVSAWGHQKNSCNLQRLFTKSSRIQEVKWHLQLRLIWSLIILSWFAPTKNYCEQQDNSHMEATDVWNVFYPTAATEWTAIFVASQVTEIYGNPVLANIIQPGGSCWPKMGKRSPVYTSKRPPWFQNDIRLTSHTDAPN